MPRDYMWSAGWNDAAVDRNAILPFARRDGPRLAESTAAFWRAMKPGWPTERGRLADLDATVKLESLTMIEGALGQRDLRISASMRRHGHARNRTVPGGDGGDGRHRVWRN